MRIHYILLFFTLFISCSENDDEESNTIVENIFDYDLVLTNQLEIDQFGELNYTKITGDVIIDGFDAEINPITNLGPLSSINTIEGNLTIRFTNITTLNGLQNINSEINVLNIEANSQLESINSLGNITSFNSIYITNNQKIENLNGLEGVSDLQFLIIGSNEMLSNLNGLNNLINVNAHFAIGSNTSLSDISALSNLENVNSLFIGHTQLTNFTSLSSLHTVNSLTIQNNTLLINLLGLEGITSLERFSILQNTNLTSLNGFPASIDSLVNLSVEDNSQLNDISNLNNVTEIYESFIISNNTELEEVSLPNLISVDNLDIFENGITNLNINGLQNCSYLRVSNNDELINFQNSSLTVLSTFELTGNDQLNYCLFDNLTNAGSISLGGGVFSQGIDFPNLIHMSGNLVIGYTSGLENLNGFASLEHVQSINIVLNSSLFDYCGLTTLANNIELNSNNFNNQGNFCWVSPSMLMSGDCVCN